MNMKANFNENHITLLIKAFEHDPMIVKLFKGEHKEKQMRAFFNFIYVRNKLFSGIYLTDAMDNPSYVAFIEIPRHKRLMSLTKRMRLYIEMVNLVRYIPLKYLRFLSLYDTIVTKNCPKDHHYYLTMLAVASTKQGKGIGTALLDRIHNVVIADEDTAIICLDTQNKDNVAYYERHGYLLTQAVKVTDLVIYCMAWKKQNKGEVNRRL